MDTMDDKGILHQADALMKRWRANHVPLTAESGTGQPAPAPEPLDLPAEEEDDIPLLTEAVDTEMAIAANAPPGLGPDPRQALREELDRWLDHALPEAVLRTLDGLADQLIGQLGQQARQELLPRLEAALRSCNTPPESAD